MRIFVLSMILVSATCLRAGEVVRVAPWEFHNSFWMSLHQTLIDDATRQTPRALTGWSPEERAAWNEAVAAYRKAAPGSGDITFAKPMQITSDAITQTADDAADPTIDAPLAGALRRAAPVYRAHGWLEDERASQFFIAYAAAMVREEGAGLIRQHEVVYREQWPQRVLVYVTPWAGPFGAYTFSGLSGGPLTTMACRDEGYQGLRALEMLLHESSHVVVGPNHGTVGEAIAAAARRHGVAIPHNLWHAILFETSSELTRRTLVARGETSFVPSSIDLFTRAWPMYREAVEKFWIPYLDGKGTLEEAIDAIVAATGRPVAAGTH